MPKPYFTSGPQRVGKILLHKEKGTYHIGLARYDNGMTPLVFITDGDLTGKTGYLEWVGVLEVVDNIKELPVEIRYEYHKYLQANPELKMLSKRKYQRYSK